MNRKSGARAERRLLVVTETLGVGGTESHLIRVLGRLAARDWDTTVYCISERGLRAGRLEAAGVNVVSAPWPGKQRSLLPRNPVRIALAESDRSGTPCPKSTYDICI